MQGLVDAHEQFKATLGEADKEFATIVGLVQEVQRLGQQFGITPPDNPYTTLHAQVGHIYHLYILFSHFPLTLILPFYKFKIFLLYP